MVDERKSQNCIGTVTDEDIIATTGDGITVHDLDFRIIYQNQAMKKLFGDNAGQLCYEAYRQTSAVCSGCPMAACLASGGIHTVERTVTIDSRTCTFETCASPIRNSSGNTMAVVQVLRNVTGRKEEEDRLSRLKNLYKALSLTNKAIMHLHNRQNLFNEVCRIAVEHGALSLALIGTVDPESGMITPVSFFGKAIDYLKNLTISIDPHRQDGCGPTGIAIRNGRPYICNDFHSDPATTPWRTEALANGINSSAAFPFSQNGTSIGALKVYAGQKGFFDDEIIALFQEMAENISFALSRFHQEEQRRQAEILLKASEERLKLVLEGSNDGLLDWEIDSGDVNLSDRLIEMIGFPNKRHRTSIHALMKLVHHEDLERVRSIIYSQLSTASSAFELEIRIITRHKQHEWINFRGKVVLRDENGTPTRVSGIVSNITGKKIQEEKLTYISMHDPLTGLFNRSYFDLEMTRLERSRNYPVSIVFADIDGLKTVNDTYGHQEGDRLIIQASCAFQQSFRGDDIISRIGGDEFAVILHGTDIQTARKAIQRIRNCQDMINQGNHEYKLSVSLGCATAERNGQLQETLKQADEEMYRDKLNKKTGTYRHQGTGATPPTTLLIPA